MSTTKIDATTATTTYKSTQEWRTHNLPTLLQYRGEWVAYARYGLLAHGKNLIEVDRTASATGEKDFTLYYVHPLDYDAPVPHRL